MSSSSEQKPHQTMASFILLALLAVLVVMALTRLAMSDDAEAPATGVVTSTVPTGIVGTPSSTATTTTTTMPTPSIDAVRSQPPGTECGARNLLCVNEPEVNARIENPVMISGSAIAFENTVQWMIQDEQETVLASGSATAQAPDVGVPGVFSVKAFLDAVPRSEKGVITVYESSARDGSMQNEVRIPVRFAQRTTMKRTLFFIDEASAATSDCTVTKGVSVAIPSASAPVEATLRALLHVDSSDTPEGLATMIPDRTRLVSLTVSNGVANIVFDRSLERDGGGACRVGAIRAQIESTLKQFSSVKSVHISVEGKTPEETLQP